MKWYLFAIIDEVQHGKKVYIVEGNQSRERKSNPGWLRNTE